MFRQIIVPLDGSATAATALPPARALAKQTGAELTLVRVVPPALGLVNRKAAAAELYLQRIAAELAKGDLRVVTVVPEGDAPVEEIVETVRTRGADLVVMATHGRGGLHRVLMGSVAEQVLVNSPVPVLLVRPGGHRVSHVKTLLVPVDGTPGAALALGMAVPLAQATRAKLVLLQVVLPAKYYSAVIRNRIPLGPDEEALAAAQSYVDDLTSRVERAGVATEGRALLGRISDTIVATAREVAADFIVMSTHGLTGPVRTLLGSTADEVAHAARCPVLLVRQGARAAIASAPVARRVPVGHATAALENHDVRPSDGW
jgi:nucleotide-binding universal stress UspA family protein